MMICKNTEETKRKENDYMITYLRMKRNEWKVKAMFYGTIAQIMDNQGEIQEMLNLARKLYEELKDVPAEDLQKEFVGKLAEIIHNENPKKDS